MSMLFQTVRGFLPPRNTVSSKQVIYADVAELADALDSGSSECKFMWVQVPSSAPAVRTLITFGLFFISHLINTIPFYYTIAYICH